MMKRLLSLTLAGIFVLGVASTAMAGIPDETKSSAYAPGGTLLIVPPGTGPTLADKNTIITVTVLDGNGAPIVGYPFQDIWVDDVGGVLPGQFITLCNGGSTADANTNADGRATISGGIAGGAWTQAGVRVYLAGVAITGSAAILIDMNSCDINGDLTVNLADFGDFSIDYNSGLDPFRSDFIPDAVVNLVDLGEYALYHDPGPPGSGCP